MSLPEVMLWQQLRRRAAGLKIRRQHPIGPYVLDFYCPATALAIEIDGHAHDRGDRPARDGRRDAYLVERGVRVLRIPATDVLRDVSAVADAVARAAGPLHHAALRRGPPPHASHGEDRRALLV